jgi:hypothetical protein
MSPLLGTGLLHGLHIRRTGHNPPCGPSAGWWVLTTANTAGTNDLTYLTKHGEDRDNKFLVTHSMTDQRCLSSAIARRCTVPSSSSYLYTFCKYIHITHGKHSVPIQVDVKPDHSNKKPEIPLSSGPF